MYVYVAPEDKRFIKDMAKDMGVTPGDIIHVLCESFKENAEK